MRASESASSSQENALLEPGKIVVSVTYTLVETQTTENVTVTLV